MPCWRQSKKDSSERMPRRWNKKGVNQEAAKLRGVNLGNWLVLEKWIHEDLFFDTDAEDEDTLCSRLGPVRTKDRLKVHRDTFITERDFEQIALRGFHALRIPVPYFLFEDDGPLLHCDEYLDRAFQWAEKYGLVILVDLHTAPGGHNGTDNSGICGVKTWSTEPSFRQRTIRVLEQIAQRYGSHPAFWGIGVLNEPMCGDTPHGSMMKIENLIQFYVPADPERAKKNEDYTLDYLKQFYRDAYEAIRTHTDAKIVFSDAFELEIWEPFFRDLENVVLDTHLYLMTPDRTLFTERNADVYRAWLRQKGERLAQTARELPLIVGEWNMQNSADGLEQMTPQERATLYKTIADAFKEAMEPCLGWFYWTWKVIADGPDAICDDAGRSVDHGWL